MEVVNTLDIDGTQWELRDVEARNRIAELEQNVVAQDLGDLEINLNPGYTATRHSLVHHYKIGKIHFANIELENISGESIGTWGTANIGSVNLVPKKETSFLLFDYRYAKILRCYIGRDGSIRIGESNDVVQGDNVCYGELIFAEA